MVVGRETWVATGQATADIGARTDSVLTGNSDVYLSLAIPKEPPWDVTNLRTSTTIGS